MCRLSAVAVFLMAAAGASGQPCDAGDPTTALIDILSGQTYKTFDGGLYAGGSNARPAGHEAAGVAIANGIVPVNTAGVADPNGRIVLISIGFSNMTQEWNSGAVGDPSSIPFTFTAKANALRATGVVNPKVLIVDGAQGGATANQWAATPPNPSAQPWSTPIQRLTQAGSTRFQVQVACVKTAHATPMTCIADDGSSTGDAGLLAADFAGMARNLRTVFPNIKLAYFQSRTYGGYALTQLNPEPYAYECGFGVKWMLMSQIDDAGTYGDLNYDAAVRPVVSPWLSWGAYLWAHGLSPNGQGLAWDINDFRPDDRTHPAAGGIDKAGTAMLNFFLSDTTTRPWFGWQCLHGDVNIDAAVTEADAPGLAAVLVNPGAFSVDRQCRADVNNDGKLDGADVQAFVTLLL